MRIIKKEWFILRWLYYVSAFTAITLKAEQEVNWGIPLGGGTSTLHEIRGEDRDGLQPQLYIDEVGDDWIVDIGFFAQTNFAERTWLKVTNRVGSKLRLWLDDGKEVYSTNPDVLTALQLPAESTVSNVMRGVYRRYRGRQWLRVRPGLPYPSTTFSLQTAFNRPFTNDVVLQITPLLYKANTNRETIELVEFPPMTMKLLSNGDVQKTNLPVAQMEASPKLNSPSNPQTNAFFRGLSEVASSRNWLIALALAVIGLVLAFIFRRK